MSTLKKPEYFPPTTSESTVWFDCNYCQSTTMGTTLEDMSENEYEWEI
jgi:hypothetical protein